MLYLLKNGILKLLFLSLFDDLSNVYLVLMKLNVSNSLVVKFLSEKGTI